MKIYKIAYDCNGTIKKTKIKARTKFGAKRKFKKKFPPFVELMIIEKVK